MMVPSWRLLKTILIQNPEMNLVMMQVTTALMKVHIKHYCINALTHQQLDLVLLGSVMSTTAVDKDVVRGRHRPTKRQQLSTG